MSHCPHFSPAAECNRAPILALLRFLLHDAREVLEVGSGSGQHAVHFASAMPWLQWQCSDLHGLLAPLRRVVADSGLPNLKHPLELDVTCTWPALTADTVFTANTLHILDWPQVQRFVEGAVACLPAAGRLVVYGPFHYGGAATSSGNAAFDAKLQSRGTGSGIRHIQDVLSLTAETGLRLVGDFRMPANNRLVTWEKTVAN